MSLSRSQEIAKQIVRRILTVVSSLRSPNRDILDFLCESIKAERNGEQTPSFIPTVEK